MSRTNPSLPRCAVLAAVAVIATWGSGCAMKTPGFSGSGLGGPRTAPATDPQVRAPIQRLQPGTQTTGPASSRRGTVVEVKEGDTLLGISQHYKVPVSVLISENGLRDLNVFPGMRLFVPKL